MELLGYDASAGIIRVSIGQQQGIDRASIRYLQGILINIILDIHIIMDINIEQCIDYYTQWKPTFEEKVNISKTSNDMYN